MKNRMMVAMVLLTFTAAPGWGALIRSGKLSKQKKAYFDEEFSSLETRLKALSAQLVGLQKAVVALQQQQTALQTALVSERQRLQGLKQSLLTMQLGQVEGFANVSSALSRVSSGEQASFASLQKAVAQLQAAQQASASSSSATPSSGAAGASSASSAAAAPVQGYVTVVSGDTITIDLGSSAGLQKGSRLDLYRASDPTTPVGVLEVTQVLDAGDANVKSISGSKPRFSDIVRPE